MDYYYYFGGPNRNFSLSKKKSAAPDLSTTLKVAKHTLKMMEIDAAVIFEECGTPGGWVRVPMAHQNHH